MNVIRYEPTRYRPVGRINRLHGDLNRLFGAGFFAGLRDAENTVSDWLPSVDIQEEDQRYVVHADLPGVPPEDIEVTLEDGVLTIQGTRTAQSDEEKKGYRQIERVAGPFHRRFRLPDTADAAAISAVNRNGVLEVSISKQEKLQPQRIKVKSS